MNGSGSSLDEFIATLQTTKPAEVNVSQYSGVLVREHRYQDRCPGQTALMPQWLIKVLEQSYGVARYRIMPHYAPLGSDRVEKDYTYAISRACPSGGASYPCELFALEFDSEDRSCPLFHYSWTQNALCHTGIVLQPSRVESLFADPLSIEKGFLIFVCVASMRTLGKYGQFAFRLLPQDVGALLAEMDLAAASNRVGMHTHLLFDDAALGRQLQLDQVLEPVFAVVELDAKENHGAKQHISGQGSCWSHKMSRPVDEGYAEATTESQRLRLPTPGHRALRVKRFHETIDLPEPGSHGLPRMERYLARRSSSGNRFRSTSVSLCVLSDILAFAAKLPSFDDAAYRNMSEQVELHVAAWDVCDLQPGLYSYGQSDNTLGCIRSGDLRLPMQNASYLRNVSFGCSAFSIVMTGSNDFDKGSFGYRGFRLQQIRSGALAQRIHFRSIDLGLGSHILLGFNSAMVNTILDLDDGQTSLLQVVIGAISE